MRVCFITNLYPPYARGGAERVVFEEAAALRALGHDVSVITAAPVGEDGDASLKMTVENGVRVYRFYPLNLFFYGDIGKHGFVSRAVFHAWDLLNPQAVSVIGGILRKERSQSVHTHNLKGLGFGLPGLIRRLGLRHVHTLHDVQLAVPSGLLMKGSERRQTESAPVKMYAAVMRRLMGSPDVVISPSKFLMKFYDERGFFPRSARVLLPNPAPAAKRLEHQPSKETRFLFLGQVEKHKGVLLLIEAMKKLLKERPSSRLEVVGDGGAMKEAVAAVGKEMRITFYGKKSHAKFGELFASADYTVVPSLCYENAPTVVVESFAYGMPVIAAEIGGAAELIKEGQNGWKIEAGSVKALAAALKRACDERARWPALSREAERSSELLTISRHAERLARLHDLSDHAIERAEPVVPIRYVPRAHSRT